MAVDIIRLSPESFQTIYLRGEDRVILRTELGQRIIIRRIVPEEWLAYRLYDFERDLNENKKEIFLFDSKFKDQISRDFVRTIRSD